MMKGTTIDAGCAICNTSFKICPQADESRFCVSCDEEMNRYNGLQFSTKIRQVLDKLKEIRERDLLEKTIVFSQFVSMFDLLKPFLKADGFKFIECRCFSGTSGTVADVNATDNGSMNRCGRNLRG